MNAAYKQCIYPESAVQLEWARKQTFCVCIALHLS